MRHFPQDVKQFLLWHIKLSVIDFQTIYSREKWRELEIEDYELMIAELFQNKKLPKRLMLRPFLSC